MIERNDIIELVNSIGVLKSDFIGMKFTVTDIISPDIIVYENNLGQGMIDKENFSKYFKVHKKEEVTKEEKLGFLKEN